MAKKCWEPYEYVVLGWAFQPVGGFNRRNGIVVIDTTVSIRRGGLFELDSKLFRHSQLSGTFGCDENAGDCCQPIRIERLVARPSIRSVAARRRRQRQESARRDLASVLTQQVSRDEPAGGCDELSAGEVVGVCVIGCGEKDAGVNDEHDQSRPNPSASIASAAARALRPDVDDPPGKYSRGHLNRRQRCLGSLEGHTADYDR